MRERNLISRFSIFVLAFFAISFSLFLTSAAAQEYNARNEFSLTQGGTSGVWNYGYTASDTSNNFIQYTASDTIASCNGGNFERWIYPPNAFDVTPQIARNTANTSCSNIPPELLFIHPGPGGERAILRWTAPAAGTFQITGAIQKQSSGATTDLKILKNAATAGEATLFSGSIGANFQQAFNFTATVAAGDKIDFSVGWGNGSYSGDGSLIGVTISQPVTACAVAPANLQVNIPGENSPVDVQSINTNASLVGDAAYTNMGKVGRAFSFDGDGDYVRIEDNAAQKPVNQLTVEGWFNLSSVTNQSLPHLISKPLRNSAENSYAIWYNGSLRVGYKPIGSAFVEYPTGYQPTLNIWNHYAFVLNTDDTGEGANTAKLYVNGVEIFAGAATNPVYYNGNNDANIPHPLLIGAEFENNDPRWGIQGQADEISIYSRALAQTEIFDIVQQGSFGKCSPGAACLSAPQGLVSFYKGEDNALDSNSLNPGALQNGATFTTGRVGRSLSFDGVNDFVAVPDNNSLDITGDLTLEAWVNPMTNPDFSRIVSKRSLNDANAEYDLLRQADGKLRFSSINGGTDHFVISNGTVPTETFTHITVTIQGDTLRFYINGALDSTHLYSFNRSATAGRLTIGAAEATGCGGSGACSFFAGQIDELSIYSRALSASEVLSINAAGANGKCLAYTCVQSPNNLVSWFAGEQNALDSRSNNHGTNGGVTYVAGKIGQAFFFDDGNDVITTNTAFNQAYSQLSVESWVNPTAHAPGDGDGLAIVSLLQGDGFGLNVYNGYLKIHYRLSSGNQTLTASTAQLPLNQWSHIAMTYDGSVIKGYVNNVEVISQTATGTIRNSQTANTCLMIGNEPSASCGAVDVGGQNAFRGGIDEPSIYNRGLSAAEISSIYNAGQSGKCKPVATNPTTNQIAWFSGDGDTRDFLGANPSGILRGDANFRVGRIAQSFNLDGSGDYVEIPDDADQRPANDLTIEGWFNVRSISDSHFISKPLVGSDSNSYVIWYDNGQMRAGHGNQSGGFEMLTTGFTPNVGTWYHFAYTIDDANNVHRFYINGAEIAAGASNLPLFYDAVNPHPLLIGAEFGPPATPYSFVNGRMDEISLFSRALSASEIASVYSAGVAGKLKTKTVTVVAPPVRQIRKASLVNDAPEATTVVNLSDATITFRQLNSSGEVSQSGADLGLLPPLPFIAGRFTGLAYDFSTTAAYRQTTDDDVEVCFNLPSLAGLNVNSLRIYHLETVAGTPTWVNRTAVGNTLNSFCTARLRSLSPFAITELAPTAAAVSLSGRATSGKRGVRGALVTLTEASGATRTVLTGTNGTYRFTNIAAGQNVVLTISAKRFTFVPTAQVVNVTESLEDINFRTQEAELSAP